MTVSGDTIGEIDQGLLLLAGFTDGDNPSLISQMAAKVVNLRIFPDERHRLQYSVLAVGGQLLVVPQFTLYGDTSRGRRPDFIKALNPRDASQLFDAFVNELAEHIGNSVERGRFGADMKVSSINDGPFTLLLTRET